MAQSVSKGLCLEYTGDIRQVAQSVSKGLCLEYTGDIRPWLSQLVKVCV